MNLLNKPLARDKVAAISGDHESIKYLENLFRDAVNLLNAVTVAQATADKAELNAQDALLQVGIAITAAYKAQAKALLAMDEALSNQSALISRLNAKIRKLEDRINSLEVSP